MADYQTWQWVFYLNLVATAIWITVLIPQFIKTVTTRDTYSISIWMYLFYPMSNIMWISYEVSMLISQHSLGIVFMLVNDCVGFILSTTILSIKLWNVAHAKRLGLSEVVYYNNYIKKQKNKKEKKTNGR